MGVASLRSWLRSRYKHRWIELVESYILPDTRILIFHIEIFRGKSGEIWRSEIATLGLPTSSSWYQEQYYAAKNPTLLDTDLFAVHFRW